jgi:hypothetical protein
MPESHIRGSCHSSFGTENHASTTSENVTQPEKKTKKDKFASAATPEPNEKRDKSEHHHLFSSAISCAHDVADCSRVQGWKRTQSCETHDIAVCGCMGEGRLSSLC